MLDSAQPPTPDHHRELPRKTRDVGRRVGAQPLAPEIADIRSELDQDELLADLDELRAANRVKDELLLSERKAREAAEAANRAKSDVLSLLSHEFRTPLQASFGYIELLEREIHGPLTDAQRRDLQRIAQSQQYLLGLFTAILDFAKLEGDG